MKKPFRLGSRVCAHAPLRVRTKAEGLRFCLCAHSDKQSIRQKKDPDKGRPGSKQRLYSLLVARHSAERRFTVKGSERSAEHLTQQYII